MLAEPSKLAAPATSPAKLIVRAVVSVSACVDVPVIDALILPVTVRSPSTLHYLIHLESPH
jgi:hypothetical protein